MQNQNKPPSIPTLNEYLEKECEYTQLFHSPEFWRQVPIVNYVPLKLLNDLSIVRFRGMVQDMLDPEIYLERYKIVSISNGEKRRVQNGKYRDCLELQSDEKVDFNSEENVQAERRTIFVVSLPAMNTWARAVEEANCCRPKTRSSRIYYSTKSGNQRAKGLADDFDMELNHENALEHQNKRHCAEKLTPENSRDNACLSTEYLLNSPIPHVQSKACMVKLYKDFEEYPLNTFIDILGFLSIDPVLDASMMDTSDEHFENESEFQAKNPPPSLIPRIHAIAVKVLPHSNPLLDPLICKYISPRTSFESIYKDTKILLTQCFLGDELCAEYLLLHLLSSVYSRTDLQNIGKFAINVCNIPQGVLPGYTQQVYSFLEMILPTSHYIPMTLENMNAIQLFPKKDYKTNKLVSGMLQLAPHTHLVVDETQLQPGKLNETGIHAIQNIAHLIKSQQIKCDFYYYNIDFDVDVPVLVISEGKSLLPSDFIVPLEPEYDQIGVWDETLKAVKHYAQAKLNTIRQYLTSAKICNFNIHPSNSELIQSDFVKMRQNNPKTTGDDLHSLLLLSRLLAISQGESKFSRDYWERAKRMEASRKARVQKLPSSSLN